MEIVKRKETERSAGGAEDGELDGGLAARSRTMTTSHADASVVQMWKQNDASASAGVGAGANAEGEGEAKAAPTRRKPRQTATVADQSAIGEWRRRDRVASAAGGGESTLEAAAPQDHKAAENGDESAEERESEGDGPAARSVRFAVVQEPRRNSDNLRNALGIEQRKQRKRRSVR